MDTAGDNPVQLWQGDCLDLMGRIAPASVDLILTDPPYFKVKGEAWDRQWDKPDAFLDWLDKCAEQWERILKPNGSLYCFASPKMSARVEVLLRNRFEVLNNIRWTKSAGWHNKAEKESLRSYLSPWESIIFCEHSGSDNIAKGESEYAAKCDELRGFVFEPLRAYLASEWRRAGLKNDHANEACGTASMAGKHYFSVSQWCLPTPEHYQSLRQYANRNGGDFLRREYEDLRREYEDLRRPFSVSADVPFTDVWAFDAVRPYRGKHPCEKPQDMLRHIITASSKPGALVLDCFMGTGATGIAAKKTGRRFIGIERDANYFRSASERIESRQTQLELREAS